MAITRKGEKKSSSKVSAAKLAKLAAAKSKEKAAEAEHSTDLKEVKALGKQMLRVLSVASDAIDRGVSVNTVIKAIQGASSVEKASGKSAKTSGSASFERATKAFGYTLRDGRADPADLKDKFKSNLERAKKDHPELKTSMFNKVMTIGSGKKAESYLISGLRKTGGEWVFVTHTADGKKVNVPVTDAL